MTNNPAFDPNIPVLTEVFQDKVQENKEVPHNRRSYDPPAAAAPGAAAPVEGAATPDDTNAHLERRAVATWTEPEWTLLERRLSERILHQLQGRVDFVLEQRLRDSMEDVLKQAMDGLTAEIRQGLQQTIEQIVLRAVSQELVHLQALKK